MTVYRVLRDPKTVVLAVLCGFAIGLNTEHLGAALLPFGKIYFTFLSMCLIPILITAIVQGIARLLRDQDTRSLFKRMAVYYVLGLVLPCSAGIGVAVLLGPGLNLDPEAQRSIGELVMSPSSDMPATTGLIDFLSQVIPANIFEALSTNQIMSIVFASVSVGIAMGVVETPATEQALALVETANAAFMQLYRWAIVLLAPGLLMLVSGVVAQISVEVLFALAAFIAAFYLGGFVLLIVLTILFWLSVRRPLLYTLSKLSNPNIMAFMTNNPVIPLPVAIEAMKHDFAIGKHLPDLVIPFGTFANQHGGVFLLSFVSVFLAQIYGLELSLQDYIVVAIGALITGATAVGGGAVLIPSIAPILGAVGIPPGLALVVLATTDNIVGPMRTVLTLQSNMTLVALTSGFDDKRRLRETRQQHAPSEAH